MKLFLRRYWDSFSFVGLAIGALFFALSLTPSLLPRPFAVQGVLGGFALAVGYGIGVLLIWLWDYMELPHATVAIERAGKCAVSLAALVLIVVFLSRAGGWQNSIRERMGMESVAGAYPVRVAAIALVTAVILVAIARSIGAFWLVLRGPLQRVIPRKVANVLSAVAVLLLLFLVGNRIVGRFAIHTVDRIYQQIDEAVDAGTTPPAVPEFSGSPDSLVAWDSIGIQGKRFLTRGPTIEEIAAFWNRDVIQPVRVYVGMRTKESMSYRANIALEELRRAGGFSRSVLIVATPTGTGWLDPGAVDTIEYLHAGDTAIVSMQYSHLPSWVTIGIDPDLSRVSARALFDAIYGYWRTLPPDQRPKLYLHGLSLGALGSEECSDLYTIFEDPIQGGVWSGPPFPSRVWNRVTRGRNPDSPMWLPRYRDGSLVRFAVQGTNIDQAGERWGPIRFVYVQHASDPMSFFSPKLLFERPAWMNHPRGPDVSPDLKWFPVVTFLQVGFDVPMATSVPVDFGHNFSASSYIDAWISVTQPKDWTEAATARLKELFRDRVDKP